jgi:hypothetical protein
MLDLVIDRREMKATIARLLRFMLDIEPAAPAPPPTTAATEITEPNPVGA